MPRDTLTIHSQKAVRRAGAAGNLLLRQANL